MASLKTDGRTADAGCGHGFVIAKLVCAPKGAVQLGFATQGNGYGEILLNEHAIFEIKCRGGPRDVGLAAGEQCR